ncbi:MAG: RNA polymerase factor sigma-54 [Proteobacteria bacterium]|nr:RNA polymerase factor sigma-54 [Pseudomonadota bacterium]
MALSQKLQQKQTTSLALTPQLRQAIHLLTLSNLDLAQHLGQELMENPLLELEGSQDDTPSLQEKSSEEDWEDPSSQTHENLWGNDSDGDRWAGGSSRQSDEYGLEGRAATQGETLVAHLTSQIHMRLSDTQEKLIAAHFIADLDEAGYFVTPLENLASALGAPLPLLEEVLAKVQRFEPVGVFARSVAECLRLQLAERQALTPKLTRFLAHLPLVGEGRVEELIRKANITKEELGSYLQLLRTLDPKPGLAFSKGDDSALIPDLFVTWHEGDQRWDVRFNEATLPKVLIDTGYYARVWEKGNREIQSYLKERMSSANWLLKALDQRAQTILKVASVLISTQGDFLREGVMRLVPLTLKEVASTLDIHESTVSRVVQNKYMRTPRGTFEMRLFFSHAVASMQDTETLAAASVRQTLVRLVEEENPEDPYSDDQLVQKMAEAGVDVARRTISKYRRILKIPSSYDRRRAFEMARLSRAS